MGQTLSEPVTEKETAHCHNDEYSVSNSQSIKMEIVLVRIGRASHFSMRIIVCGDNGSVAAGEQGVLHVAPYVMYTRRFVCFNNDLFQLNTFSMTVLIRWNLWRGHGSMDGPDTLNGI